VDQFDFSDHRYYASRVSRRAAFLVRAARHPEAVAALTWLSQPANQSRCVFIVGAARSGTTALQTAMNAHDDVFLLGEAFFFWENLRRHFRARYNRKHRGFGYPPSKQNDCPAVAPEDGTWIETLIYLAKQYRFVGDKIPFGGYRAARWPSEFLAFQRRHFHCAAYLLCFRNPRDAILSPQVSWGIQDLVPWARSYIAAQRVLIRLRANFARTVPIFLENVQPATYEAVERCLGQPMPLFSSILRQVDESPLVSERIPDELRDTVNSLAALYPELCRAIESVEVSRFDHPFSAIDTRLAGLYHDLDPLYYSTPARLARLRSRVLTASRMARNLVLPEAQS
jgi:hypothetical protein